jgi:septal ring factor EnvC (AmiA/AmiB activator)
MLVALVLVAPASAAAWSWPSDGPVLRGFDFGGPEYQQHGHSGIDMGGTAGAAVRAPAAGEVSFAGWLPRNGRTVTIRTPDGYAVTLLHLGTILASEGDGVAEAEPVGTIGPSGDVEFDVPYVHLGIRRADDPKGYVDPLTLLPPRPSLPPAEPANNLRPLRGTSNRGIELTCLYRIWWSIPAGK